MGRTFSFGVLYMFLTYTAKGVSLFYIHCTGSPEPFDGIKIKRLTLLFYACQLTLQGNRNYVGRYLPGQQFL